MSKLLIKTAAKLAANIYREPLSNLDFYDRTFDIEGNLYQVNNKIWLVWKGSETIRDWKVNLTLGRANRRQQGIGIHKGYNQAYRSVQKDVLAQLKGVDILFITGHSSGGAITVRSAFDLALKGKEVVCVTFGAPKLGSKEFAHLCNTKFTHFRVENFWDAVPYVPLWGYSHSGDRIGKNFVVRSHKMERYQLFC